MIYLFYTNNTDFEELKANKNISLNFGLLKIRKIIEHDKNRLNDLYSIYQSNSKDNNNNKFAYYISQYFTKFFFDGLKIFDTKKDILIPFNFEGNSVFYILLTEFIALLAHMVLPFVICDFNGDI